MGKELLSHTLSYRHDGEKVRNIMTATKEQERKALEKIREIVESLGKNSYIGTALDGCFEIAEENIEFDCACSMKNRYESAIGEAKAFMQATAELGEENKKLKNKVEQLEKQLDRELEWKPYIDKDNVSQSDYEHLVGDMNTRFLSDEEAKDILYDWFGFAKEKVKIINNVNTYEINRHGRLRKTGTIERRPAYNATDWNYIRFNCGCISYELCNDQIRLFAD